MLDNKEIKITDVQITSNAPYFSNRAVSGKFQKRYTGIQFFDLKFSANYMSQHSSIVQKFVAQYQYGNKFKFPLSYLSDYQGTAQGIISSTAAVQPGGRIVSVGSFTGTLAAGTIVQFVNHKKLYTVMEDLKANGQLKLFPALKANVQVGEQISYRNLQGEFIITNDSIPYDLKSISKLDFTATEAI